LKKKKEIENTPYRYVVKGKPSIIIHFPGIKKKFGISKVLIKFKKHNFVVSNRNLL